MAAAGGAGLGRALTGLLLLWFALVWALGALLYTPAFGEGFRAADFNMFHAAGRIAWQSGLAAAYEIGALDPADIVGPGGGSHDMLYTYPPQFGFVILPLGGLGRAAAFAVFVGLSLALYLAVLLRLAGREAPAVLLAGLPVLTGAILSGQTGLLIGGLAGLACLGLLAGRASAGLALGLAAVKPHLAPGFAVYLLARRRWRVLAVAGLTVAASLSLATLVFGWETWRPFLEAGSAAAERLSTREFKLNRMTSVYALAATAGLPHGAALALHLAGAAVAVAALIGAARAVLPERARLGVAALATLAFSPYVYDYDLTLLVLGLALLWGDLVARSALWERLALGALAWATTWYVYAGLFSGGTAPLPNAVATDDPLALQALAYLGLAALVAQILRRARHSAALAR